MPITPGLETYFQVLVMCAMGVVAQIEKYWPCTLIH